MFKKQHLKNAAVSFGMSTLAGLLAGLLVKMSPAKAREFVRDPGKLAGFKIPSEWATTFGGSFVGLTVVEVLSKFVPGIGDDVMDYIQDFATMVGEEIDDKLKQAEAESGKASTAQGERSMPMKPRPLWFHYSDPDLKGVVCLGRCPAGHELDASGKRRSRRIPIDFDDVQRGNFQPPTGVDDCICAAVFAEELAERKAATEVPSEGKPSALPKEERPPSLATLLGRALKSDDDELKRAAEAFCNLLATVDFNANEYALLEHCDNLDELKLLLACKDEKQLRAVLSLLVAYYERGIVGSIVHEGKIALAGVADAYHSLRDDSQERAKKSKPACIIAKLCADNDTNRHEVFCALQAAEVEGLCGVEDLTVEQVRLATESTRLTRSLVQVFRDNEQKRKQQIVSGKPELSLAQKLGRFLCG